MLVGAPGAMEVALLSGGRLVSSQLLPANGSRTPAALERSVARQLADQALPAETCRSTAGSWRTAPRRGIPMPGEGDLLALARGRLEAPDEFFASTEPAMLPAVGAALDAVREGTVPRESAARWRGASGADEGLSLATVVLVALTACCCWCGAAARW